MGVRGNAAARYAERVRNNPERMLRRRALSSGTSSAVSSAVRRPACACRRRRLSSSAAGGVDKQYTFMRKVASGSPLEAHVDPATGRPHPFPGVKTSVHVNMAERYELDEDSLLGHGSFGVVHSGTDKRTGQRVALKAVSKASGTWNRALVEKEVAILVRPSVCSPARSPSRWRSVVDISLEQRPPPHCVTARAIPRTARARARRRSWITRWPRR